MWADRDKDLIIVMLANRVHPSSQVGGHVKWRADVSDQIVTVLGY